MKSYRALLGFAAALAFITSAAAQSNRPLSQFGATTSEQLRSIMTDAVGPAGAPLTFCALGTAANNCVQLNTSGALPAVSGANLTGVLAATLMSGATVVANGTPNGLFWNSAGTFANLASADNGVLVTNDSGKPSIVTALPSGVTFPSPGAIGSIAPAAGSFTDLRATSSLAYIGSGLTPPTPGSRAPVFIWTDPSNNLAGQNAALQLWMGNNPTATPGAGDFVTFTAHADDIGRGPVWVSNFDAQQSLVGGAIARITTGNTHSNTTLDKLVNATGIVIGQVVTGSGIPNHTTVANVVGSTVTLSQAATTTASGVTVQFASPGIVRGLEINVVGNHLLSDTTDPYSAGAAIWAYECNTSIGSTANPLSCYRVDSARDNTTEWPLYGLTMRRVKNAGVTFQSGSEDANKGFLTALLWQKNGTTPAGLKLDGTVTHAIDALSATLTNILRTSTFTLTAAGSMNNRFTVAYNAGIGSHQLLLNDTGGNDAAIAFQSNVSQKWTLGNSGATNDFFFSDGSVAMNLVTGKLTSGSSSMKLRYHNGTSTTLGLITTAPTDSCGAGFKCLRVPN